MIAFEFQLDTEDTPLDPKLHEHQERSHDPKLHNDTRRATTLIHTNPHYSYAACTRTKF